MDALINPIMEIAKKPVNVPVFGTFALGTLAVIAVVAVIAFKFAKKKGYLKFGADNFDDLGDYITEDDDYTSRSADDNEPHDGDADCGCEE